jgi:hypothetical protein
MQATQAVGAVLGAMLIGVGSLYDLPVWKLELMNASIFMVGMLFPFAYLLPTDLEKLLESLRKQLKDDARRATRGKQQAISNFSNNGTDNQINNNNNLIDKEAKP